MTPIFFPFTWIPRSVQGLLFACFERMVICQPARKLVPRPLLQLEKAGRLDIWLPDEASAEQLPDLLKAHLSWAELHQGEQPDFHKFAPLSDSIPDDASTAWIRHRLLNSENEAPPPHGVADDPLLTARLFLAIAQAHDRQSESLSSDLFDIERMEKNMLHHLSPDRQTTDSVKARNAASSVPEPDRSLTPRRLAAWEILYANCLQSTSGAKPAPSPLFVTSDRETLGQVLDVAKAPEPVCRIEGIRPVGEKSPFIATAAHREMDEMLRGAIRGVRLTSPPTISFSGETAAGDAASLIFYRIEGGPAAPPFSELAYLPESRTKQAGNENAYALLGCIERTSPRSKLHP